MKLIIIICILLISINTVNAVEYYGKSYCVIDANTGYVIDEKNKDYSQSVASISKIMTVIIAIEEGNLDDVYTISDEIDHAWGSCVYIHKGDTISLKDLLYGAMLRSGNDACLCIAKNIGKDIQSFVDMMNKKAKELNMVNTVFHNPTGLDDQDEGNISSAYDMAILMKYCTANPIFNDIIQTKIYQREDGLGKWKNKNRLLDEYEYCVGGKTGYTQKAKRTLVTRAIKDDCSLIIVTINCGNDFEFHKQKYEECFENIDKYLLVKRGIYNYNGHSFVVDDDIFYYKDYEVSYRYNNKGVDLYLNDIKYDTIYYKNEISTVIYYALILMGDCFG